MKYRSYRSCVAAMLLAAAILGSGCTSMRFTSSVKIPAGPSDKDVGFPFNIASTSFEETSPQRGFMGAAGLRAGYMGMCYGDNQVFRDTLMQQAQDMYPRMFADSSAAIPLTVSLKTKDVHNNGPFFLMLPLLIGTIIPMAPLSIDTTWSVDINVRNEDTQGILPARTEFKRLDGIWFTPYSPLGGIIPVPGRSDRPKVTKVTLAIAEDSAFRQARKEFDMQCIVQSIVDKLDAIGPEKLAKLNQAHQSRLEAVRSAKLDVPPQIPAAASAVQGALKMPKAPADWKKINLAVALLSSEQLSSSEAKTLTDNLNTALVESGYFNIISRSLMSDILKEQAFTRSANCDDSGCLTEMGKLLSVSKMIGGSIGKVGSTYSVTVMLVDVETGKTDISVSKHVKGEIDNLLELINTTAVELVLKCSGGK